jgi:hypothetical protein
VEHKPEDQPDQIEIVNYSETQITIKLHEMTDASLTGDSPITIYSVEWDKASNGSTFEEYLQLTDSEDLTV